MRNIFLAGAHRTGKSTVAATLAERLDIQYIPTNVGGMSIWNTIGSASAYYSYTERCAIQQNIYNHLYDIYFDNKRNCIFDRSYIDLVGYLSTNHDSSCSSVFDNHYDSIMKAIQDKSIYENKRGHIYILQPNDNFKYCLDDHTKNSKVYNSYAYRQSLTDAMIGFCVRRLPEHSYTIVPENLDIIGTCEFIIDNYEDI